MMKRFLLPALLLICGLIAGCQSGRSLDEAPKIGVVLPLSGTYAQYGKEILNGIQVARAEMAVRNVNGFLPELLIYDDFGDGRKAQEIVRKLAAENVAAVLVGYTSHEALAVKDRRFLQKPWLWQYRQNGG